MITVVISRSVVKVGSELQLDSYGLASTFVPTFQRVHNDFLWKSQHPVKYHELGRRTLEV